jgi:hypothetical protein
MSPDKNLHKVETIIEHAAERALGSRTRLRLLAVTAWAAFLGAIPTLLLAIMVIPPEVLPTFSWGLLSTVFLAAWVCAFISASIGVLLTHPKSTPRLPGR